MQIAQLPYLDEHTMTIASGRAVRHMLRVIKRRTEATASSKGRG